jgi:hypothetical protein
MLVAIGLAIVARGDVRVFVTPASQGYVLTVPANAPRPTFSSVDLDDNISNAYDYYYSQHPELPGGAAGHYYSVAAHPPIDAPSGTPDDPIEIAAGDFAYIWFQFENESKGAKLNGLEVLINGPDGFTPTYYLQNDLGNPDNSARRWNGTATAPDYPEWHHNLQLMVAITASGIVNGNDNSQMMFDAQGGTNPRTGVALLGAVQLNSYGTYFIRITNWGYASGHPTSVADPSYFAYVPEPAAWTLAGLIVLALRRRA